jgi:zinc and cadmium transporter
MMCFASGSLLADAISHLSEVTDPVIAESNSKWALVGVLLFFFVDKFSRYASRSSRVAGKDKKLSQMNIGYLSLIADAVHNFTDGLAISASFSRNLSTGIATTFAIFLHEIPHELGDYAVLAKAGFNHGKIINLQIGTAIAAFLGTLTGLGIEMGLLGSVVDANFLLPLSCGGFLYLGLCSILAEVMADEERNGNFRDTVVDLTAFVAGGALLHLLEHHVHE